GRIAERADGKLELKAAAKGKNPDLDLKLSVAGNYKVDLPAKAFEIAKLDAAVNGAAAGITNLDLKAKGDVAANPEKDEYRVNGFALDFKGVQEKQNMEAHIAAPELVVAADKSTIQAKLGLAKFSPPAYQFDVNIDKLNLDRYTKQPEKKPVSTPSEEGKAPAPTQQPAPAAQKKDEDTPVDLSALKGLNANG